MNLEDIITDNWGDVSTARSSTPSETEEAWNIYVKEAIEKLFPSIKKSNIKNDRIKRMCSI